MKPAVLNVWPKTSRDESRICVESTCSPARIEIRERRRLPGGDLSLAVVLSGVGLAMAPDEILVADGLVRRVLVSDAGPAGGPVTLDVVLEHLSEPTWAVTPGMPALTELAFPRDALVKLLCGTTIAIDPGHGGRDAGVRGPVNLVEKGVALEIAVRLRTMLSECGAMTVMSREDDRDVDARGWAIALSVAEPSLLVEVHARGEADPTARSYHVYARSGSEESFRAAGEIAGALTERMGITFSGIEPAQFPAIPLWPAVRVEPVCLTHFVDEANFRAPLFRMRIGQAIFNGICRYVALDSRGGTSRAG